MKLFPKPTPGFVRAMTDGHSVLGLAVSTLLYIVCVSGTLAVFYPDFERWEQASVAERLDADASTYNRATAEALELARARGEELERISFTVPNADKPRLQLKAGDTERYVSDAGELQGEVVHEWTHFLVYLHFALNLPVSLGVPIVGLIGVLMAALIVSGLLAHPRIIKDAFSLRLAGSARLQQVDLHNRLGVWASPFHLAIALTGAFIGLSQVVAFAIAALFYNGDVEKVQHMLFMDTPKKAEAIVAAPLPDFAPVLAEMRRIAPDHEPIKITLYHPGTDAQALEVTTRVPDRLVWGERFRFDSSAQLVQKEGWSDGSAGKQVYASNFRLHFGHFAGLPVKVAYFLLGLGMCVMVVTGINIWLVRKRQRGNPAEKLERVWMAQVWGVPFAIAFSAATYLAFDISAVAVFWLLTAVLSLVAAFVGNPAGWSAWLRYATVAACVVTVVIHAARFGADAFSAAALLVNLVWLVIAGGIGLSCLYSVRRERRQAALQPAQV